MNRTFITVLVATSIFVGTIVTASQPKTDAKKQSEMIKKGLAQIKDAPNLSAKKYTEMLNAYVKNPKQNSATPGYLALVNSYTYDLYSVWLVHDKPPLLADTNHSFDPGIHGPEILQRLSEIPVDTGDEDRDGEFLQVRQRVAGKKECPSLCCSPKSYLLSFDIVQIVEPGQRTLLAVDSQSSEKSTKGAQLAINDSNVFCRILTSFLQNPLGIGKIRYLQLLYYHKKQQEAILQAMQKPSAESTQLLSAVTQYLSAADRALKQAEEQLQKTASSASTATAAAPAQGESAAAKK